MKNIFNLLFVLLCLSPITNRLQAEWINTNGLLNVNITTLTSDGTNLYAGTYYGDVFISTDNGDGWTAINNGLTNKQITSFVISGSNLFVGTWGGGVYLSTNNGSSWTSVNNGLTDINIQDLAVSGTNLFAGTIHGIFRSTDNGTSWTAANSGINGGVYLLAACDDANVFATVYSFGIYHSANNGDSWTKINNNLTNLDIDLLAVNRSNIFVFNANGIFLSTNNGTSWNAVNNGIPIYTSFLDFAFSGENVFAGTAYRGFFLSTNNGSSWSAASTGLPPNCGFTKLTVCGVNLFAYGGIDDPPQGSIWKRPLSELTAITDGEVPSDFMLLQNYPNPFNPTTEIIYELKTAKYTKLAVYNAKGELVKTLVDGRQTAGNHSVKFEAANLNSGIYFYKLEVDGKSFTHKMMLLK